MTGHRRRSGRTSAVILALALTTVASGTGCGGGKNSRVRVANGSPDLGAKAIRKYGCGSCHTIPGIREADALVGPPLIHWSRRTYVGGEVTNTPDNLARWIQNPKAIEPNTAMPDLGVTPEEARNIAAYLLQIN